MERRPARLRALHSVQSQRDADRNERTGAAWGLIGGEGDPEQWVIDPEEPRRRAEEVLVRKLRSRSLSISEARLILRGHELGSATVDDIVEDFSRKGYLDDTILAGHLVAAGIERKGQGRVALKRALAQRGIPRDVIDAALADVPDDDDERALEFARSKAKSMSRLDFDTALRRLTGQLARRGYHGSTAMSAARTALAEVSSASPSTGVRFVDSD